MLQLIMQNDKSEAQSARLPEKAVFFVFFFKFFLDKRLSLW